MALVKQQPQGTQAAVPNRTVAAATAPATAPAPAQTPAPELTLAPIEELPWEEEEMETIGNQAEVVEQYEAYAAQTYAQEQALTQRPVTTPAVASAAVIEQDYSALSFDWTSFPTISLKLEGEFVDIDNVNYGKEFNCRVVGWKRRWVYRASPVEDNRKDLAFSYDEVTTQTGILLADKIREWQALGKQVSSKEYLEVVVEMVAEGYSYDGEYRILSVSPTSKGRFAGYISRAQQLGGGNPYNVVTKVSVGAKVTKVQNPFYPWNFTLG